MIEEVITSGSEVQLFNILISLTEKSGGGRLMAARSRTGKSVVIILKEQFQFDSWEAGFGTRLLGPWRNTNGFLFWYIN